MNTSVETMLRVKGFYLNPLANFGLEHLIVFENKEDGSRISINMEDGGGWVYSKSEGEIVSDGVGNTSLISMLNGMRHYAGPIDYVEFEGA